MTSRLRIAVVILLFFTSIIRAEQQISHNNKISLQVQRFEINRGKTPSRFAMNAYVVYSLATRQALLIDPGHVDPRIAAFLEAQNLTLVGILNTHGHGDHTGGNRHHAKTFSVKVYSHQADLFFYHNPKMIELPGQVFFSGEKDLVIRDFSIQVLETPGHSRGSVCFLIGQMLFSGDTLRAGTIGRPAGTSAKSQEKSRLQEIAHIKGKLLVLPDETPVYPGHGEPTTIGNEKKNNKWLREMKNGDAQIPLRSPSSCGRV